MPVWLVSRLDNTLPFPFPTLHSLYTIIDSLSLSLSLGTIPATPENITVTFLTPTAVRVSWQTQIDLKAHPIEKYIVTYKPTDDR